MYTLYRSPASFYECMITVGITLLYATAVPPKFSVLPPDHKSTRGLSIAITQVDKKTAKNYQKLSKVIDDDEDDGDDDEELFQHNG